MLKYKSSKLGLTPSLYRLLTTNKMKLIHITVSCYINPESDDPKAYGFKFELDLDAAIDNKFYELCDNLELDYKKFRPGETVEEAYHPCISQSFTQEVSDEEAKDIYHAAVMQDYDCDADEYDIFINVNTSLTI